MKKILAILIIILLTGCAHDVPVTVIPKFPDVPKDMLSTCPDLALVDPTTTKLSELTNIIVDNYGQYYNCKSTVDNWIEWYNTQKNIFNNIK
jgi:hypothetical protein